MMRASKMARMEVQKSGIPEVVLMGMRYAMYPVRGMGKLMRIVWDSLWEE